MTADARKIWLDMIIGKTIHMTQLMFDIENLHALIRKDLETEIEERDNP